MSWRPREERFITALGLRFLRLSVHAFSSKYG